MKNVDRDRWIMSHAHSRLGRMLVHLALVYWHIENANMAVKGIWREIV